jgi:L-lactate utilization protein LutC
VVKAAPDHWQAAMTILERRDPTHWGSNNYKTEIKMDPKVSYNERFETILKEAAEGNICLGEANQLANLIVSQAKCEEISSFRKELEELKTEVANKE